MRYDAPQSIADQQKEQARENIGAESATGVPSYSALLALTGLTANERVYLTQYDASNPSFANIGGGYYKVVTPTGGGFFGLPTISSGGSGYTNGRQVVNLVGGGCSGSSVFATVEAASVTIIEWRTPGTGCVSAPSFNWADLPGAGTPGSITFSLADQGAYVRTSAGALLAREELLEEGVVRPEWWGAKGIQSGDDGPAMNTMFLFLRTAMQFGGSTHFDVQFRGNARYNILTGINATKFQSTHMLKLYGNGSLFHVRIAGGVGIDFTGSRNISWSDLQMYGDAALTPKYGVVLALQSNTVGAPWNDFENAEMFGFYTDANIYNFSSEFNTWNKASITNSQTGGKALIIDPINSKGWSSPYAPSTATINSFHTISQLRFESSRFSTINAPEAIEITGPIFSSRFVNSYAAAFNGAVLGLYQNSSISGQIAYSLVEFDIRGEPRPSISPSPVTDLIKFYSDLGAISLHSVSISDYGFDYSRSLLRNEGSGNVNIRDAKIQVGSATTTTGTFASGGNIGVEGYVAIDTTNAPQANFSGLSSLRGTVFTRVPRGSIVQPTAYGYWLLVTGSEMEYASSQSNLLLPLRVTIGQTQIREYTADPEGVVSAPPGSLLLRRFGNTETSTVYVKVSGTGTTGWSAIVAGTIPVANGGTGSTTAMGAAANIGACWTNRSFVPQSRVSVNGAGDATEVVMATYQVPANAIGPNGSVKAWSYWNTTGGTASKTYRTRWNGLAGSVARATGVTTNPVSRDLAIIGNRNATNLQFISNQGGGNGGWGLAASNATAAVDTTAPVDIVFTSAWAGATAGETIVLEGYEIEICAGS